MHSFPMPSALPLCPEHPEQPSVATCERCGRFLCQRCLASEQPPRCAPCDARAGDPLGILAQPFSVGGALSNGWRLFVGALSGIAVVSLIMAIPFRLILYVLSANGLRVTDSFRLSRLFVIQWSWFYENTVGFIGVGATLALLVGVAEGGRRSLGQAIREGLQAWPILFGACLRRRLWIALFTVLFIIPGIIKTVTLAVVAQSAYREPKLDALKNSTLLTSGRRWEVLGMSMICLILPVLFTLLPSILGDAITARWPSLKPIAELLSDTGSYMIEAFSTSVGLAAFYGLKHSHGQPLAPR